MTDFFPPLTRAERNAVRAVAYEEAYRRVDRLRAYIAKLETRFTDAEQRELRGQAGIQPFDLEDAF